MLMNEPQSFLAAATATGPLQELDIADVESVSGGCPPLLIAGLALAAFGAGFGSACFIMSFM